MIMIVIELSFDCPENRKIIIKRLSSYVVMMNRKPQFLRSMNHTKSLNRLSLSVDLSTILLRL